MNTNITFGPDNKYTWIGGLGVWFKSKEKNINEGDVRCIEGKLFKADNYNSHITGACVYWTPVEEGYDVSEISKFKAKVVGL